MLYICCLRHPSAALSTGSPASPRPPPPFPFASPTSHLNICLALWWVPSCHCVFPMKQPTICSVVHNTLGSARTYGGKRRKRGGEILSTSWVSLFAFGPETGLRFAHLRCRQCKPATHDAFPLHGAGSIWLACFDFPSGKLTWLDQRCLFLRLAKRHFTALIIMHRTESWPTFKCYFRSHNIEARQTFLPLADDERILWRKR